MAFTVTVKPRAGKPSKRFPITLELAQAAPTVADLKSAIAAKAKARLYRERSHAARRGS